VIRWSLLWSLGLPVMAQVPQDSTQALIVVTPSWEATQGQLYRFVRANRSWTVVGVPRPVVLGRTGLAWGRGLHSVPEDGQPRKKEGDGRAPAGIFSLGRAYGYGTQALGSWPYQQSQALDRCVDDSSSTFYNQILPEQAPVGWTSAEEMRRRDDLYRLLVVVNHNTAQPTPQGGSCIFLHVWRSSTSPTVGCTAMAEANLQEVVAWLDPKAKPILIQLPQGVYQTYQPVWDLPKLQP